MPTLIYTQTEVERFWSKIDTSNLNGCMPWTSSCRNGYGQLRVGSLSTGTRRVAYAHRMALEIKLGRPINPDKQACHTCDNPSCCNPEHIYEGTRSDNIQDAIQRGPGRIGSHLKVLHEQGYFKGEGNGMVKLTQEQVQEIRIMSHMWTQYELADIYGVSQGHVSRLVKELEWRG